MNSMTGYGRAGGQVGSHALSVQVSSVNRKTFDLSVVLPRDWEVLEPAMLALVRQVAQRGKITVEVELTGKTEASEPAWDEAAAARLLKRLAAFAKKEKIPFNPTPELLWSVASSQRKPASMPTADQARPELEKSLGEALRAFAAMRAREGEALLVDFLGRVEALQRSVTAIAERAAIVPGNQRQQLHKRLRDAGLDLNVDDERVLKEIALFADRSDVSEELTRVRSHLDQFLHVLKSDKEIGRKAEFILLEIGREVHTIGSKANDLAISRAVIELKNELERIREQIANVE